MCVSVCCYVYIIYVVTFQEVNEIVQKMWVAPQPKSLFSEWTAKKNVNTAYNAAKDMSYLVELNLKVNWPVLYYMCVHISETVAADCSLYHLCVLFHCEYGSDFVTCSGSVIVRIIYRSGKS